MEELLKSKFWKFVAIVVAIVVLNILKPLTNGWVLSILWGWFMVPTLGLPVLTIVQAVGVALVVGYFTHQTTPPLNDDFDKESKSNESHQEQLDRLNRRLDSLSKRFGNEVTQLIRNPILYLFIGWIFHHWM